MKKFIIISISLAAVASLSASCGKLSIFSDGLLRFRVTSGITKSVATTTASINTEGNTFLLDAWLESANRTKVGGDEDPHYICEAPFTLSGTEWRGDGQYWCDGVFTDFWAVFPAEVTGRSSLTWPVDKPSEITDEQEKNPGFTYDMSSYAGTTTAAADTPDLLVSYARGIWNDQDKTGGVIKFEMQHVLSAIYFTKEHFDEECYLTEISISGVQYAGTCTLVGSTTSSLRDTVSVSWAFPENKTDKSFSQVISETKDNPIAQGKQFLGESKYFFMIPQPMQPNATLTATITGAAGDPEKQVVLSGYSWKPGYNYEYKLSYYKDKDELIVTTTEFSKTEGTWTD